MAAGTITDKTILAANIAGYAGVYFSEKPALIRSGAVSVDSDPAFSALQNVGGNTFARRRNVASTADWEVPVAATSPTINALSTASEIGAVARRVLFYGEEDFASIAGGQDVNEIEAIIGQTLAHRSMVNIEKLLLQKVALAAFTPTTGALQATHLVNDPSSAFDFLAHVNAANILMGENINVFDTMLIHSAVYHTANGAAHLDSFANSVSAEAQFGEGMQFIGMYGNLRVFLCDRMYNAGGVYDTILCGPGAFRLDYQLRDAVEVFPRSVNAGGTSIVGMKVAVSPGIKNVSYTATAPTALEGATDANLAAPANYTKVTGASVAEIPIVCIKTLA